MLPSLPAHRICLPALLIAALLTSVAEGQEKIPDLFDLGGAPGGFGDGFGAAADSPTVEAAFTRTSGTTARLDVTASAPTGHYIYSMNTPFGMPTKIELDRIGGVSPAGSWKPDHEPKSVYDDVIQETMEKYYGPVTWSIDLTIPPDADGSLEVSGSLSGQYCSDEGQCFPIRPALPFAAVLISDMVPPSPVSAGDGQASEQAPLAAMNIQHEFRRGSGSQKAPIRFRLEAVPLSNEELELRIHAEIDRPYHTFSLHQNPEDAGLPTEIFLDTTTGLEPLGEGFVESKEPELEQIEELDVLQKIHFDEVTFSRRFLRSADTFVIEGAIDWQVCRDGTCLPPTSSEFRLASADGIAAPLSDRIAKPDAIVDSASGETSEDPSSVPVPEDSTTEVLADAAGDGQKAANESLSLPAFIWAGVLAGFVSLLTPCVFPMIPVTVSFFLKQGEEGKSPLGLATIYCVGIILAFTGIGLLIAVVFGPASLNQFANNAWLNLFIAAVFLVFAAALMGMFEIRVPSWMLTWSSKQESRGGVAGVLFMALTFTLVSFTCTFAFIGPLLVTAAKGEEFFRPIVGMLAFSTAFASPFFVLALFPQLMKKLPKSGGWMNTVKVTMGFIEIGIALKYLSVADIGLSANGTPVFFDYTMVFSIWIVVALATGLYLLGLFRLPHDSPADSISPIRCMFALLFLSLGGYMLMGLTSDSKPTGELWAQIDAFAPPHIETAAHPGGMLASGKSYTPPEYISELGRTLVHDGLPYALDFDQAVVVARKQNLPLFIDVTGTNCVNCRYNEKKVMPQLRNFNLLKQFVRVQAYVDDVPTVADEAEENRLKERNTELQSDLLQSVGLPTYAVIDPNDLSVLSRLDEYEPSGDRFYEALREGLERFQQRSTVRTAPGSSVANDVVGIRRSNVSQLTVH